MVAGSAVGSEEAGEPVGAELAGEPVGTGVGCGVLGPGVGDGLGSAMLGAGDGSDDALCVPVGATVGVASIIAPAPLPLSPPPAGPSTIKIPSVGPEVGAGLGSAVVGDGPQLPQSARQTLVSCMTPHCAGR